MRFAEPAGHFDSFGASSMASTKLDQGLSYGPKKQNMTAIATESHSNCRRLASCSSSSSLRSLYQSEEEMTSLFESCWRQVGSPDFVTSSQMFDLLSILEELVGSPFFFTLDDEIVGHLESICKPSEIYMKPEAFRILTIILDDIRVLDYDTQTFYGKPQAVDRHDNAIEYYVDQNYHIIEANEITEEGNRCLLDEFPPLSYAGYDDTNNSSEDGFEFDFRQQLSPSPSFSSDAESIMEFSGFAKGHLRTVSSPTTEASFEPIFVGTSKPDLSVTSTRVSSDSAPKWNTPKSLSVAESIDRLLNDYQFVNLKYSCLEYEVNSHCARLLHQSNELIHLSKSTTNLELRIARLRSEINRLKPVNPIIEPMEESKSVLVGEANESTIIPVAFWVALIIVIISFIASSR